MKMEDSVDPTLCNRYPNQEQEYVFCTKGRPFGCLVSPHLPTPTSSLIDYGLVRDVGMKMTDLQYTKLSFCGQKFRILGKVSVTVQTIHNGLASGNFHLKANVVLDLFKNLDIECVAGAKLTKQLEGTESCAESLGSGSSSPPSSPRSSPSTPARSPRPSPAASPPRRAAPASPTSPPGFPAQPQYRDSAPSQQSHHWPPAPPQIHVCMTSVSNPTPLSLNLHSLEETFANADIMRGVNREIRALHEADPEGKINMSEDQNQMTFITTGGLRYEFGHGRNRCHPAMCKERTKETIPNNCGYHGQWLFPNTFQVCGPACRGALCACLNYYT